MEKNHSKGGINRAVKDLCLCFSRFFACFCPIFGVFLLILQQIEN